MSDQVWVVGEVLIDLIPDADEHLAVVGGGPANTAKALAKANLKNKTILLTGAMIPYAFGGSSDGFFNLGCALSYVQTLTQNVYITMQGQSFLWNEVQKNSLLGRFEKI